jgi:hypothetical protein
MKKLILTATLFLTVFTASAQISYVEDKSTIVYIYGPGNKQTGKVSMQASYQSFLGSTSDFLCIMDRSGGGQGTIYIYDYQGKQTGRISLNGGDTFSSISGSNIILKRGMSSFKARYDRTGKYLGTV